MWDRWASLASLVPWGDIATTIRLEEAGQHASLVLAGAGRGLVVVGKGPEDGSHTRHHAHTNTDKPRAGVPVIGP